MTVVHSRASSPPTPTVSCEEGIPQYGCRTSTRKLRPKSGLDSVTCAEFESRTSESDSIVKPPKIICDWEQVVALVGDLPHQLYANSSNICRIRQIYPSLSNIRVRYMPNSSNICGSRWRRWWGISPQCSSRCPGVVSSIRAAPTTFSFFSSLLYYSRA